jgi:pre-mRNA-processing factor 6
VLSFIRNISEITTLYTTEEAHSNGHLVNRIVEKMIVSLNMNNVVISRDNWIKEAEAAEQASSPLTAAAIIANTIHLGVDEEDRLATWSDDADTG